MSKTITNPFEQGSFVDNVKDDISPMQVGDTAVAKAHGEDTVKYRMTLKYAAGKLNMKFKTKTSLDGTLWIKRVA